MRDFFITLGIVIFLIVVALIVFNDIPSPEDKTPSGVTEAPVNPSDGR